MPLKIYTHVPRVHHASYAYRIMTPLMTARDLGLNVQITVDSDAAGISPEWRMEQFFGSDVVILYHPVGDGGLHNARASKTIIPSKRDGEWKYPSSLVVETDDNLFDVSPFNPAFKNLGTRDHTGAEMPIGSRIGVMEGGQKKVVWRDKAGLNPGEDPNDPVIANSLIDIATNRHTIETYQHMLELADLVSCTTPRLKARIEDNVKARSVEAFPNLIRLDQFPQVALAEEEGKVKILWQGGAAHHEDWHPLRYAMKVITDKYPQVHWIIWGQMYPWAMGLLPPDRYTFVGWCPYHEYKLRLCMMGHDISLAPLQNNRFNDCRSAIKFYESSVLKKPAATLAQRTGPYADEIIEGETGLLFNDPVEFSSKLSHLIEDATERKRLAANAKQWVSEHRDAMKETPKYIARLESLRESTKRDHPHMPEAQWEKFIKEMEEAEAREAEASKNGEPIHAEH